MTLTLNQTATILKQRGLLREVIAGPHWSMWVSNLEDADQPFKQLTYDTREVTDGTLLFIKGNFNSAYLKNIDEQGLAAYVSQTPYPEHTNAPGFIVNDVYKAMAILGAEFFSHPERELAILGVTDTKGKTTTAYFTHAILNAFSDGKAAMFSSVDNCLDGHTYNESNLTTPESLDAFRMMRQAVDNGVRYLASPLPPEHSSTSALTTSAPLSIRRSRITSTASDRSLPTASSLCSTRRATTTTCSLRTRP